MYTLEDERSEKYKELVTLPYRQTKNLVKLHDTQAFFIQDEINQRVKFQKAVVDRWQGFLQIIEGYVGQGVEVQLSAFWDIAPNLVSLLQQIPEGSLMEQSEKDAVRGGVTDGWFGIQIPANEQSENPSYEHHPMQYLYTLLEHAEKSAYQFMEAQINLLCLLHEVRCDALLARNKLEEARKESICPLPSHDDDEQAEKNRERIREEVKSDRQRAESELTQDLKERVTTVESLWTEALGSRLQGVRDCVKDWLMNTGGWEDMEGDD